jgi:hypothetical protein
MPLLGTFNDETRRQAPPVWFGVTIIFVQGRFDRKMKDRKIGGRAIFLSPSSCQFPATAYPIMTGRNLVACADQLAEGPTEAVLRSAVSRA